MWFGSKDLYPGHGDLHVAPGGVRREIWRGRSEEEEEDRITDAMDAAKRKSELLIGAGIGGIARLGCWCFEERTGSKASILRTSLKLEVQSSKAL